MDIVARIVLFLRLLTAAVIFGALIIFGLNLTSLIACILIGAGAFYLLHVANTPLRPNRYRPLDTPWTDATDGFLNSPDYPRPQMQRGTWLPLNGAWQYAITKKNASAPAQFDGTIKVPFPIESRLSGVARRITPRQALWYRRDFEAPEYDFNRLLLHFGAVDWQAEVWVNGHYAGKHCGGHDAFFFDIAPFLDGTGRQELLVKVWDPTNIGFQPRGKQVLRPGNIYYTPVTGIWQTVWLEPLGATSIDYLGVETDIEHSRVILELDIIGGRSTDVLSIDISLAGTIVASHKGSGNMASIGLPQNAVKLWSGSSPTLYDLDIKLLRNDQMIDSVHSYFAMRKIEIRKDKHGVNRIFLNNAVQFQLGLLDQGWWPDGLYTAPTDEALLFDIEQTRAMGFNMIRKHVKVEPARWYYHCDRLGILVWQDMPTGDRNILPKQRDLVRGDASEQVFRRELTAMIRQLRFFPCIVCWVPFNEGWGQFKTNEILQLVRELDPTRLVDGPSGWVDRGEGDMRDYHIYNRRLFIGEVEDSRSMVIGEFGGIGFRLEDHMAVTNSWSYNSCRSLEEFSSRYESLILEQVLPLIEKGLAAAVYTQTTDVESEINGLMSYDRKIQKIELEMLRSIHSQLYEKVGG
jgi:hypothetical protein